MDHTWDNVLIEYETALKIKEETQNSSYIIPVFVGEYNEDKSALSKFKIMTKEYPESITAVADEDYDPDQEDDADEGDEEGDDDGDYEEDENNQQLPDTVQIDDHEHVLKKLPKVYHGSYDCNICGFTGMGTVFHCAECEYDAHPYCALHPPATSEPVGDDDADY